MALARDQNQRSEVRSQPDSDDFRPKENGDIKRAIWRVEDKEVRHTSRTTPAPINLQVESRKTTNEQTREEQKVISYWL
jgi:hypothetical protein